MFISKEVETLYYQYRNNPFGKKKDRRIESWLEILGRLPTILNAEVELINEINIDFDIEDNEQIKNERTNRKTKTSERQNERIT